ncbi:MAG: response regulator [Cyanobacteria bacterium SZAS-4]|nr:response regulator [Cyanobacteria bacterium SZAS-4]
MESRKPLLLIVEDDPLQQKIFALLAERYSFRLEFANSGLEALNLLASQSQFDVIIMDWKLPNMSGLECTRAIREREMQKEEYTPIIGVTAYATAEDRRKCLASGMDDYLSKPFDMDEFHNLVVKWTGKKGKLRVRTLPWSRQDDSVSA